MASSRYVISKLLRSHLSTRTTTLSSPPVAVRSLCSVTVRSIDSDADSDSESSAVRFHKKPSSPQDDEVPGEKINERTPYQIKLVNDDFYYIRLDLPGLGYKELKLSLDAKKDMVFEGRCKTEPSKDYTGGFYSGTIPGCPLLCDMEQIKAELNDGVLWITLPLSEDGKKAIKWQSSLEYNVEKKEL